ncbi:MAG: transcription termination factor Rho [Kofleriaceae bacterium]|nr:transcription termination factor Rho [Kofleriaceae bacterium]MBP9172135.1 transcription termination factor Rho [Kofleriaceae bacterium]
MAPPSPSSSSNALPAAALELGALRRMPEADLLATAERLGVDDARELRKSDLILAVLEAHADRRGETHAEGVLEVLSDGFGFLRNPDATFAPGADDVYVSPSQIRRFGLRTGDTVRGTVRAPKESERYFALLRVETVEGGPADQHPHRADFEHRPAGPATASLDVRGAPALVRHADLLAPLGLGQRILIKAPPRGGKSGLLGELTRALVANHPTAHVTLVAIDVRPEEAGELGRGLDGHVAVSTLADPPARHVQLVEMLVERGKRIAEAGGDAIVVIDSLGRLARAWNVVAPPSGRALIGALDAAAAVRVRRLWAGARRLLGGGSLTLIGTLTIDSGQRLDEVMADELAETASAELVLGRPTPGAAPTLDRAASYSRQAEALVGDLTAWHRARTADDAAVATAASTAGDRAALIAAVSAALAG